MRNNKYGSYFVEVQERSTLDYNLHHAKYEDLRVKELNEEFLDINNKLNEKIKIGVIYLGRHSPGGNNVVDGLLRF